MNLVVPFSDSQSGHGSIVGGKGANLMALTAAGFPVPGGFVVSAVAYQQFLAGMPWLDAAIAEFDYARPDHLRERCAAVRQRLKASPLPPEVRLALEESLRAFPPDAAFAVRSSSTFEDLAQAAFAGQHDTYLNIRGPQEIAARTRDCFASLWEDRAVLYRHHQGFAQREARMAVVVQQQIESQVAGVGFSIDPVLGRMDRMLINANYGLGESVVSGECEIDQFELDKQTLAVVKQTIGNKTRQIVAHAGGTREQAVSEDLADKPCMDGGQIRAIAELLQRVEAHYGWPQDIEWGIKDGRVHQFQSRPVTTVQPCWTRDESAERFPRPMTPLSWDFISVAFRRSLGHSMALMGLPPLKGDWFANFDHYIYGNQNAVRLLAMFRPLRARNAAELAAEIPELRKRFGWVMDLPVQWARDLDRYLLRLGRLQDVAEPATLQDGWRFTEDVLQAASDYFLPNIAISMTQSGLHRLLHSLIAMMAGPEKALAIVDGLLTGCETKTALVNAEIYELAALAQRSPALARELMAGGSAFIQNQRLAAYPVFARRFTRFLEDHGHRELDMDYAEPTWAGQPGVVLDTVALLLGDTHENPAEAMRAQRLRFAQTEQQFLTAVPPDLRFFFRELVRLARTYTILDDLEHYQTTRINPLAHRAALWLGHDLQSLGVLDVAGDVFFLQKADLESLVADAGPANIDRCRKRCAANKASFQNAEKITPPWSLQAEASAVSAESSNLLRGLAGSPGRATAPCFLIHGPEDFGRFPKGAILVARTTNPAWTALFYSAAGVITESGGPLSHGAVTAREMGLPAVMSVRGVMTRLRDGDRVSLDGSQGTVEIH